MLAALHREPLPETLPLTPQITYAIPVFDTDALLIEVGLMLEWYLPDRGAEPSGELRDEFIAMWRELLAKPAAAAEDLGAARLPFAQPDLARRPRAGIRARRHHRLPGRRAGTAPPTIWCRCCRMRGSTCPEQLELALLTRYIKARRAADDSFDPAGFAELYAIMSAQRNTRLLGTFARLNRRDGKPQYLRHQPRIWTYLNRSLAHPALVAASRLVCRQRAAAGLLIYHLLADPALIWSRLCSARASGLSASRESSHGDVERRKGERVTFERGYPAHMMGIDGTWRRECMMEDVSETGAKLTVEGSVEGLHLKEFFLLLSSTGLAYRRCELA